MKCDRICSINDPDKGCLLGGVESCRIGSEQVLRREEKEVAPAGQRRLIDANALREKCDAPHWCVWMSEIDDEPTVDAVEVVRCKDCVYYKPGKHFKDVNFCQRLPYYAEKGGLNVSDDDFCSRGERRNADKSRDLSGYADKLREIKEGL